MLFQILQDWSDRRSSESLEMRLYHHTTLDLAEVILHNGFLGSGNVMLSNLPSDSGAETARENTLLLVLLNFNDVDLSIYELTTEDEEPHQWWSVPAEVVNQHARVVHMISDVAIIQEDLRIKVAELSLIAKFQEALAVYRKKVHLDGGRNPDIDIPEQELSDLVSRRNALESKLIAISSREDSAEERQYQNPR
jgi:hypothetical protein